MNLSGTWRNGPSATDPEEAVNATLNKVDFSDAPGRPHGMRKSQTRVCPFRFVVRTTSTGLLVERGHVLLGRRTSRLRFAGMWDAFGGHLEPGETPGDALRRELREELGIEVTLAEFVRIYEDVDPTSGETFRHHLFVVRGWDGDPGIANEEHSEIRWFRPEEVPELNLTPSLKQAIVTLVATKA